MKLSVSLVLRMLTPPAAVLSLFFLVSLIAPLPPLKPYSLVVEDRNGSMLQAFRAGDGIWRLRTPPDEIPGRLKEILIRREDRWFYYHPGVNPFAIVRALMQNARSGRRLSGASTLTMQIARMLEPKERTYLNKAIEVFRALQLEMKYSKEELLEIYLSMAPLGGNVEGLKSAALLYYQTPLERLNIAQLFDLILVPGDPNGLQPDKNGGRLLAERKRQASRWIREGVLTPGDSMIIGRTPAATVRKAPPRSAPHFALRAKEQFARRGEVRTSLDLPTQLTVERLLTNHLRPWKQRGVRNGAVVVVENRTREVVAYAGSEDFADSGASGQVDAVRALRSPGSTLKPFLYAMAMDRGALTPRKRLLDTPYDAEGFQAENYDGRFSGSVYADDALRRSLNVPLVRMLKTAGVAPFVDVLASAGVRSLRAQQPRLGLSMILGGCGVTLEEMVGAYASFPNGGVHAPLRYEHGGTAPAGAESRVFSASAAWMVTEILAGLDRPDLPGNIASATNLPSVAFKTGTSYGRRDAWGIGYSSEFTVGVWIGNVTHQGNPDLVGSASAAPLLIDIFNSISASHQKTILPRPKDIRSREVCARSGLPPGPRCTHRVEDVCSDQRSSRDQCAICTEAFVSPDGGLAYCAACAADHPFRVVTIERYPPELVDFWRRSGTTVRPAPAHNPLCRLVLSGDGPAIVSPSAAMTYFLVAREQRLALQAASGVEVREHAWYLDDAFIGKRKAGEKLFVAIAGGEHTITCTDDRGRSSFVRFTVHYVL
jgi:penicillin-binding protein 1C